MAHWASSNEETVQTHHCPRTINECAAGTFISESTGQNFAADDIIVCNGQPRDACFVCFKYIIANATLFFLVDGWVVWVAQNNFLMSPVCCFAFVARLCLCLSRIHGIWRASHSHPRTLQSPISYSPATIYRAFTPFSIMCRKQNETKILKHRSNPSNGD